ncbi:MAG: FtsP/CotA-like multicopper oxidase with cupredoxin domain [Crocinitomicaceae bacterium]|jgi:FtsP/CotA-like multicopper oxidase with cupredoxin domain
MVRSRLLNNFVIIVGYQTTNSHEMTQPLARNILSLLLLFLTFGTSFAQEHPVLRIQRRADVLNGAKPQKFFPIPELHSDSGELKVDLYINEQSYNFNGDSINMRTYTYESGEFHSTKIGPWAPTFRIQKDDRLTVTIHNNLPIREDENYLGSISLDFQKVLDEEDYLRKKDKRKLENATLVYDLTVKDSVIDTLMTFANLEGAFTQVVVPGESWIIHGRVPCPCPTGQKGACKKILIDYPVRKMYNYGTKEMALRIYEEMNHDPDGSDHNTPHGFSNTNLHAHGFHVSPAQDDIFRNIGPTYSSYYTYDLVDHTAGTMWYHPHVHGSTSLQVASGMSGAIVIEDDFSDEAKAKLTAEEKEALEMLEAASNPDHERVMVFNQVLYDETIGEIPDFNTLERSPTPKGTTVNGVAVPTMIMKPGEVQRWRMVHAGYRSNLAFQFPKGAEVWQIAVDGIQFDKPRKMETVHMAPGNRTDLLIKFPMKREPQVFAVKSISYLAQCEYFETDDPCLGTRENYADTLNETIMIISLTNDVMAKEMHIPTRLTGPGAGHPTIKESELVNRNKPRVTSFSIVTDSVLPTTFLVNERAFDGAEIPDTLVMGTAEQWKIRSAGLAAHPYHIHINPFQVMSFNSKPLTVPMWKDVIMVEQEHIEGVGIDSSAIVYARYDDYWGDFVLHCHILAHEDEGMMQRVRIVRAEADRPPNFDPQGKLESTEGN